MTSGQLPTPITQRSLTNQDNMVGLQTLHGTCQMLYPDQPNPLQVTARLKYWLGGPDPLDYISMYWNPGRPELSVPPHWHYISFGLSDLHGDGRVHPLLPVTENSPDIPSGFGIELTMRVLGEAGTPPIWPAALLQRLATYIFTTGNCLLVSDHVSWHAPLDGGIAVPPSAVCHMIIAQDPQLPATQTPLGKVQFVQVVGVTKQELRAAQRYGGAPLLAALSDNPRCGGSWFITDMNRRVSVEVEGPIGLSDLSGVAAHCQWKPISVSASQQFVKGTSELAQTVKEEIKCILQKGLSEMNSSDHLNVKSSKTIEDSNANESNTVKDECKMSTDSVKFTHMKSSTKDSQTELPSMESLIHTKHNKPTNMSTDSFKMTDIEHALMEDIQEHEKSSQLPSKESKTPQLLEDNEKNQQETHLCLCERNENNGEPEIKNINMFPQCQLCGREHQHSTPTILTGVHLILDKEAASLLPLALRSRVLYKSHFTWSRVGGGQAITVLGGGVTGTVTSPQAPIAALKGWLQILIPEDVANEMINELVELENEDENHHDPCGAVKSFTFQWDTWKINISISPS